jgi:hypothetical protein
MVAAIVPQEARLAGPPGARVGLVGWRDVRARNPRETAMSGLGGAVAIIGTGTIKFGENFHQSLGDMIHRRPTCPS